MPQETYTLTLTPDKATIEPNQSTTFTATVTKNPSGTPSKPIPVTVEVKVDATSGGHDHGETVIENVTYKRPKGTLSTTSGNTSFPITFTATDVSGKHTITATCDLCENTTASVEVTVKVDGLEPIPASAFYIFIGGEADKPHHDNHYLTPDAIAVLWNVALNYSVEPQFKWRNPATNMLEDPPLLHVNDGSLMWGGRFDTKANWTNPHVEHMSGTVVDIRANNATGAIAPRNFGYFNQLLSDAEENLTFLKECTKDKTGTPPAEKHNRTWPDCISKLDGTKDTGRHYHVRLKGVSE